MRLFENNKGLILQTARRYIGKDYEQSQVDDLMQEGFLAIQTAVKNYEAKKGTFGTILSYALQNQFLDFNLRNSRGLTLSYEALRFKSKYKRALKELTQELKEAPTPEQIAEKMGVNLELLEVYNNILTDDLVELDRQIETSDGLISLGEAIPDTQVNIENEIIEQQTIGEIWEAVKILNETDQNIFKSIICEKKTYKELGRVYGVSHETIRQKYEKGLEKIRKELNIKNADTINRELDRNSMLVSGGYGTWKSNNNTSCVELIVLNAEQHAQDSLKHKLRVQTQANQTTTH